MKVRVTRAVWDPRGGGMVRSDYAAKVEDADLEGDDLFAAVLAHEAQRHSHDYSSTARRWANGAAEVEWTDRQTRLPGAEVQTGRDLYRGATERGVRQGGCRDHDWGRCWNPIDWPAPPGQDIWHTEIGPLGRLRAHQECWWRQAREGGPWTYPDQRVRSVAMDRCCDRPFALTNDEATSIAVVCRDISTYLPFDGGPLTNIELLLGWRLFGVHERGNSWPGVDWKAETIDPDLLAGWWVMDALTRVMA